jgi:hypothetical protein
MTKNTASSQFRQHFTRSFCTNILAPNTYKCKYKKLPIKCWWNWLLNLHSWRSHDGRLLANAMSIQIYVRRVPFIFMSIYVKNVRKTYTQTCNDNFEKQIKCIIKPVQTTTSKERPLAYRGDHFLSPNSGPYKINLLLNNDHLSTTASNLGSRGWSLNIGLTELFLKKKMWF